MASRFILPLADVGNGVSPSDGAKLYFYETGTTTKKATYTDGALSVENANPVISDGNGLFPAIWLPDGSRYKIALKDKNERQTYESDPIANGVSSAFGSKTFGVVSDLEASSEVAINDIVDTTGYTTEADGGDNRYKIVAAGTGTDDGGWFINLLNHQAKALFPSKIINAVQFGLIEGKGQSTAVRQANTVALNNAIAMDQFTFIPQGEYELHGKIVQNNHAQTVQGYGAEFFTYHNDDHAWEMGGNTSDNDRRFRVGLYGIRLDYRGAGYASGQTGAADYSGLVISQLYESLIQGVSSNYYKNLVLHQSAYSASFFNYIHLDKMEYGEVGYFLHAQDTGTDHGLINTNVIHLQRVHACPVGIRTLGDNGPGQPGENIPGDNKFWFCSVEDLSGNATIGIEEGGANNYIEPRIDGSFSRAYMEFTTDSRRATVVSHLFFLKQGTNLLDNGEENHIQVFGYDQVIQANSTTLAASLRRTATNSNVSLVKSTLQWTISGTGTSTYYLEQLGGGQTQREIPRYPPRLLENNVPMTFNNDISSLSAGEWGIGDQDTLGFKTIYVRLADGTDPDSKVDEWVEAKGIPLINQFDEGANAGAASQICTQAGASLGTDGYFMRGVDFLTGEEQYRIPMDGGFMFNRRTTPIQPDSGATIFVDSSGNFKAIKDDGTIITFTVT